MAMSPAPGGMQRGRRRAARPMSEINVTPMVDVMLVLLIIFMVSAPLLTAGVHVDLPQSNATPLTSKEEPLVLTLKLDGTLYIQETAVDPQDLIPKLEAITKEKKDTKIYIKGDKGLAYGKIMEIMGNINGAGFEKVALLTEVVGTPKSKRK